jgi:hypothetical protein
MVLHLNDNYPTSNPSRLHRLRGGEGAANWQPTSTPEDLNASLELQEHALVKTGLREVFNSLRALIPGAK